MKTINTFTDMLERSAARHSHLCPRQVLGVRIGLAGMAALGIETPCRDHRLLVILETDGCFADGVEVVTGASIGHRTLRVEDYGKIAATFIDVKNIRAFRLAPRLDVRQRACEFAPGEKRHYFAQLQAYQFMPDTELLVISEVRLIFPVDALIGQAGVRTTCEACGEEIINHREVIRDGGIFCRACLGDSYYTIRIDAPALERIVV